MHAKAKDRPRRKRISACGIATVLLAGSLVFAKSYDLVTDTSSQGNSAGKTSPASHRGADISLFKASVVTSEASGRVKKSGKKAGAERATLHR